MNVTEEKGFKMRIWIVVLAVYVIARRKGWGIREWLEIILAGLCLFLILHK